MTLVTFRHIARSALLLLPVASIGLRAQASTANANLLAAARQIREGDSVGTLFTLDRAEQEAAGRPGALARVHAYRTWAYVSVDQPERAKAAALQADPAVVVTANEFTPELVTFFDDVRHPAGRDSEAAGDAAAQVGRLQKAFLAYLDAWQLLPGSPSPADDQRLREKIIRVVQKLPAKLIIPPDAAEHMKKANDLEDAEAVLGSAGSRAAEQAVAELQQAVRIAPWWPDATIRLAKVLQKLQRTDEAVLNLNLYKLEDPAAYAASVNRGNPNSGAAKSTSADPAVIYLYRPHIKLGPKKKLTCDGVQVADLENGRFVRLTAAPGAHDIKFFDAPYSGWFEAGREHYIRFDLGLSHVARFIEPEKAKAQMRDEQITANDPKNTFSAECPASGATSKQKRD